MRSVFQIEESKMSVTCLAVSCLGHQMFWASNVLDIKCEPPLFKEMYKLAKDKKASRMFIVNEILDDGFNASAQGKYFFGCGVS